MKGPFSSGDHVGDRYEIISFLGEGGMQFVYHAKDLVLNRDIALKTPKNQSAEKRFHRSAILSSKVNHPNVAKTLDYFEKNNRACLIEELIVGDDLENIFLGKLIRIDPYLVAKIFHHLAKGLSASHHSGVIHRDLKPTNVMISGGFNLDTIKITDFGIAKMAGAELDEAAEGGVGTINASATALGALPYMAPEAISTPKDIDVSVDIWSLGAMMYELLTGKKPFGSGLKAVAAILSGEYEDFPNFVTNNPQFKNLSEPLIDIIKSCLSLDRINRPTADDLVSLCGQLCYPTAIRFTGVVKCIKHSAWGFIGTADQGDVFFHPDSVYADTLVEGDRVLFSKFAATPAHRAHPIVKLK